MRLLLAVLLFRATLIFTADPREQKEQFLRKTQELLKKWQPNISKKSAPTIETLPPTSKTALPGYIRGSVLKKYHSGPEIIKNKKPPNPPCLETCNCCNCNHLHDVVRIALFNENYDTAQTYLKLLKNKMAQPGEFYPPRLDERVQCYNNIIACRNDKYLRTDDDKHKLAIEGIALVQVMAKKAEKKDEELFTAIETVLSISGSIFSEKALGDEGYSGHLERVVNLIKNYRDMQVNHLPGMITVANVNEFSALIEKAKKQNQEDPSGSQ